jgi:hypothetical protein
MTQCADKSLDRESCNMLNAFYTVKSNKLFDCYTATSIELMVNQSIIKDTKESIFQLKSHLFYLESLHDCL